MTDDGENQNDLDTLRSVLVAARNRRDAKVRRLRRVRRLIWGGAAVFAFTTMVSVVIGGGCLSQFAY